MTLDEDVAAALKRVCGGERGVSFKEALNAAVRAGLRSVAFPARRYRMPGRPLELRPGVDLTKALQLAAALEDEELVHKLELRK